MSVHSTRVVCRQTLKALQSSSRQSSRQLSRANRTFATSTRYHRAPLSPTTLHRPSTASPRHSNPTSNLIQHRTIFIQTEETPNTDALKFKPNNTRILPASSPDSKQIPFLEYLTPRSTLAAPYPSPLAAQLLGVDGVNAVFYGADYITVTKDTGANWAHIKPEVFALITETITAGTPIVTFSDKKGVEGTNAGDGSEEAEKDSLAYDENDDEVVGMIKELLETRIRPAIQEDGGDIDFRGFVDGQVLLKLRGACRTCDSSTVTLKNGIESMLCHYIEEVQGVQQVLDPEEEVAMREFAKFEEKLKQQKGPDATKTSPSLDSAP